MPQFTFTAKRNLTIGGQLITKGDTYNININSLFATPQNALSDSRFKDAILKQFAAQGLNIPPNVQHLRGIGLWDVKRN